MWHALPTKADVYHFHPTSTHVFARHHVFDVILACATEPIAMICIITKTTHGSSESDEVRSAFVTSGMSTCTCMYTSVTRGFGWVASGYISVCFGAFYMHVTCLGVVA